MKTVPVIAAVSVLTACVTAVPPSAAPIEVAITVDDLPVHGEAPAGMTPKQVADAMIAALQAGGVSLVYGFVNAAKIADDPATATVLDDWRKAGNPLGNHGWAHRPLSAMTVDEFESELTRNEPTLSRLAHGSDWRWFRYPFLDEGKDAAQRASARNVLAAHHYKVAAVSMSFGDWQWTAPYVRCTAAHDSAAIAELERLYLVSAKENLDASRAAARKLFGRDIPYVLLMHVSAMSAHMMPRLLQLYRNAGVRFVSLDAAQADPAYRAYTDPNLAAPPSPQEQARQAGVTLDRPADYSRTLEAMCTPTGAPA